jgi:hypothetical protein
LTYEMAEMFWSMDRTGQEKAAVILAEFMDKNKQRLVEISREHPARKEEKVK